MMRRMWQITLFSILALALVGCNTVGEVLPPNDQVLLYKLPYDLTYLRTLEALNSQSNWVLEITDKEKGLITLRDINYSRLDDSDLRSIAFAVKRVDDTYTSISILPECQRVYGGEQLLKVIGEYLNREVPN